MKIYRLEHKERKNGPYSNPGYKYGCDCVHCRLDERMSDYFYEAPGYRDTHPDLCLKHLGEGLLFGCSSQKKLKSWFKEFWKELEKLGYVVVIYDKKPVYKDDYQVAFLSVYNCNLT